MRIKTPLFLLSLFSSLLSLAYPVSAAVVTVAEYHLGEAGSLGTNNRPQDAIGTRHFTNNIIPSNGVVTGTTGVAAPGSTAYLNVSSANQPGWYDANYTGFQTDNFGFGIYASASALSGSSEGSDIFTLGGNSGAFKLSLGTQGWAASAQGVSWISATNGNASSFAANTWTHLALIRQSGTTTFYINGVAGGTYGGAPSMASAHMSVNPGDVSRFYGLLDEARVVTFSGSDSTVSILTALQVPEPSTAVGLALGLAMLAGRRRLRALA